MHCTEYIYQRPGAGEDGHAFRADWGNYEYCIRSDFDFCFPNGRKGSGACYHFFPGSQRGVGSAFPYVGKSAVRLRLSNMRIRAGVIKQIGALGISPLSCSLRKVW